MSYVDNAVKAALDWKVKIIVSSWGLSNSLTKYWTVPIHCIDVDEQGAKGDRDILLKTEPFFHAS